MSNTHPGYMWYILTDGDAIEDRQSMTWEEAEQANREVFDETNGRYDWVIDPCQKDWR